MISKEIESITLASADAYADGARGIHDETDMSEMLNELRILLPGAQLLNGFLITLPFNSGFQQIVRLEKWIFMATFLCSLSSLILFTAPAVQHRVLRPLDDRVKFKNAASRQMLAGALFLSLSLVLCSSLVIAEVVGHRVGLVVAAVVASLILALWWVYPAIWRKQRLNTLQFYRGDRRE